LPNYANDVALVIVAKHLPDAKEACSETVNAVMQWLRTVGLSLATHKRAIRYLEVVIDTRLSYREHFVAVQEKAARFIQALSRTMLNNRGLKQERRLLLTSVTRAITLYAVPIWADAFKMKSYARSKQSTHRLCAVRFCSAFKTVSSIDILARRIQTQTHFQNQMLGGT